MNFTPPTVSFSRRTLSTAIFMVLAITAVWSQKIGYVNSTMLLQDLPMMTSANAELEKIQKEYMAEGDRMVKDFEADYTAYMNEANEGVLSKKQMAEREANLQRKRQEIMDYDTKAKATIEVKREGLFRPVLQKIDEVIQQYGETNNYDFILDAGMGNLLYKQDADDLTQEIRSLLMNQ